MNREETKKRFKSWCQGHIGNNASDEDYHMFNNIMALLEQEPVLDKIRGEIESKIKRKPNLDFTKRERERNDAFLEVLEILDKYKADAITSGKLIPDNATNGDMIMAMFPKTKVRISYYTYAVEVKLEYHSQYDTGLLIDKKWWNTPYKAESEDNK